MKVVVVTGGIGSGKSMACTYLNNRYGWPVYEADSRVKDLYACHATLLAEIETALGANLRRDDGRLDPQALSAIIFNDSDALALVESIVFPVLLDDFEMWKSRHADSLFVVLESATILEKPQLSGIGDYVILIDAPVNVRLDRAASRDKSSYERVKLRMASQEMMNKISDGILKAPVDRVVENVGSVDDLREKLDEFVENAV